MSGTKSETLIESIILGCLNCFEVAFFLLQSVRVLYFSKVFNSSNTN